MTNTLFVGKVYCTFDELTSTNDYALELLAGTTSGAAKSKPSEGTVIRTDIQTAGRGQFGSRWESEEHWRQPHPECDFIPGLAACSPTIWPEYGRCAGCL